MKWVEIIYNQYLWSLMYPVWCRWLSWVPLTYPTWVRVPVPELLLFPASTQRTFQSTVHLFLFLNTITFFNNLARHWSSSSLVPDLLLFPASTHQTFQNTVYIFLFSKYNHLLIVTTAARKHL